MGMHIDESWRHGFTGSVNPLIGLGFREIADGGNPIASNSNICANAVAAGSVDNIAAGNHQVEALRFIHDHQS
jgi:hypothetical protein